MQTSNLEKIRVYARLKPIKDDALLNEQSVV